MKKNVQLKETILKGYIIPIKWDGEGNVIAIEISTDNEDYLVDMNKMGNELLNYADEEVNVTGIITHKGDGIKSICITSYEWLDGYTDDDEGEKYRWNDEDPDFGNSQGEIPY